MWLSRARQPRRDKPERSSVLAQIGTLEPSTPTCSISNIHSGGDSHESHCFPHRGIAHRFEHAIDRLRWRSYAGSRGAGTDSGTGTDCGTGHQAPAPTGTGTDRSAGRCPAGGVIEAKPGQSADMILLPKFMGNAVFDEANQGAEEAKKELQNAGKLSYVGPTADNSVAGQIEIVTNAPTQGAKAIMISNNAGDQLGPSAEAARKAGLTVVTWDSPIPSAQGEQVFVAQVDFKETGTVLADMALDILGADGGKFAVLSASPDAANQNAWIAAMKDALKDPKYAKLDLVDVVYGNDQSEESYNQTLALIDEVPRPEADHRPHHRRHRLGGQGLAG